MIAEGMVFYQLNDELKYHIVAILNNEPRVQVVFKYFGINKKWWHYEIESLRAMQSNFECGLYLEKRKKDEI